MLLGIEKKYRGKGDKKINLLEQVFSPSIPYIEKRWKKKRGKSICWSCSKWPDFSPPNLPSP
jgi:hypothetical protein